MAYGDWRANCLMVALSIIVLQAVRMEEEQILIPEIILRATLGEIEKVQRFLDEDVSVNTMDKNGITPLSSASRWGQEAMVSFLLESDASVNLPDNTGRTPLMKAAVGNHSQVAKILLQFKADPNIKDNLGETALTLASVNGNLEMVSDLLEAGAQVNNRDGLGGKTPLMRAVINNHPDVVKELLDHKANISIVDKDGNTALIWASYHGHLEIVDYLLASGANVNDTDDSGGSSLLFASIRDHSDVVRVLLQAKADPNLKNDLGSTALLGASFSGNLEIVQDLLAAGADVDQSDGVGGTALIFACLMGYREIVRLLLESAASVNLQDTSGTSALTYAVYSNSSDVVRILLQHKADPDIQTEIGYTALMTASDRGYKVIVQDLLEAGANPNLADYVGVSSLMRASIYGYGEVVKLLLKSGASVNYQHFSGETALMVAAQKNYSNIVEDLLDYKADPDITNKNGQTALMIAVRNNYSNIVEDLMDYKADLDITDKNGTSALMFAATNGDEEITKMLLQSGASVNLRDNEGWTALMFAARGNHSDIVEVLLEYEADPNILNRNGVTAMMLAFRNKNNKTGDILRLSGTVVTLQERKNEMILLVNTTWKVYSDVGLFTVIDKVRVKNQPPRMVFDLYNREKLLIIDSTGAVRVAQNLTGKEGTYEISVKAFSMHGTASKKVLLQVLPTHTATASDALLTLKIALPLLLVALIALAYWMYRENILQKIFEMKGMTDIYLQPQFATSSVKKDAWEFPRSELQMQEIIGEGFFAKVWRCEASGLRGIPSSLVAVKILKDNVSWREHQVFQDELNLLKSLGTHPNVVPLLGCCTDQDPVYIILEHMLGGALESYLRSARPDSRSGTPASLSSHDLIRFMCDVSHGMEFLEAKQIIHRDLATRNVLLDEHKVCKIADFGFARDISRDLIYEREGNDRLPIRWMSPESVDDNIHTVKSDVWSFGILLWEISTLASTPYPGIRGVEATRQVRAGFRLQKPNHCDREIYDVMYSCWNADPDDRPSFSDLVQTLEHLSNSGREYIKLQNFHDYRNYNIVQDMSNELV